MDVFVESLVKTLPVISAHEAGDPPVFPRLGIVGCGLIGGSLAMAARQRWPASLVIAVDRKDVLETAMRIHAVDVGGDDLVMVAEADLIVLAAPVRQNIDVLQRLADYVPGRALVTDVGSTKVTTTEAAAVLPERLRFIGGHPLAGAAAGGIEAARADLFNGRPWLLAADEARSDEDIRRLEAFVTGIGATPRRVAAEAHDLLLAYLSHLPQLAASALMHVVGEHAGADGLSLSGRGLRDTTRLATSPVNIWRDVTATNRDHVAAALDDLIAVLESMRRDLGNGEALDRIFTSAARWKRTLEADHLD
jgi:prephenate dehydrogenase